MDLALSLPENSSLPLYKQLAEAIRSAIADGKLRPGEKLPSSRALAESLSVSRETASRTYAELASQGFIRVTAGSGVFVNEDLLGLASTAKTASPGSETNEISAPPVELSPYGQAIMSLDVLDDLTTFVRPEFNYQAPTLDDLPIKRWRDVLYKSARLDDASVYAYVNDPFGYKPLREAIAAYLARRRAISCHPDQIAIFNTTEGGTDVMCRLLLKPGDFVAVENPGTPGVRLTLQSHQAQMVPISVDAEGVNVDELNRLPLPFRLIYVTPSHHDPTGAVLTPARRRKLIDWAQRSNAFIIEDDFDSEYRYGERPVPALKGLDDADVVIYRYNFWRALYPLVRVAFMVLPQRLVAPVWRYKSLTERDVPLFEQRALAMLIEEGHVERHMRRTLAVYSKRRMAFVQTLKRELQDQVEISPVSAGMHVLVHFNEKFSEEQIVSSAAKCQLTLLSTSGNYLGVAKPNEFVIGFAYTSENDMRETVKAFCEYLKK